MAFKHDASQPFEIGLCYSNGHLQEQRVVNYAAGRRRRRQVVGGNDLYKATLRLKYDGPLPIKKAKYDDLQKLLGFIPPHLHLFYQKLKASQGSDVKSDEQASNTCDQADCSDGEEPCTDDENV